MTYSEAHDWCKSKMGNLPAPETDEENEFLGHLGNTWLGIQTDEAKYLDYINWAQNYPNGNANRAMLINRTPVTNEPWFGKWKDSDGQETISSTCYINVVKGMSQDHDFTYHDFTYLPILKTITPIEMEKFHFI